MEQVSCGAILYSFNPNGELGIILGDEGQTSECEWLPFKGGRRLDETLTQAAIREVYEETGGLVQLDTIELHHKFTTKRKEYNIGLCEVPYSIISEFDTIRKEESRESFKEKKRLKFFKFPEVLQDNPLSDKIHNITKASILYYKDHLTRLGALKQTNALSAQSLPIRSLPARSRYLGMPG